MGMTDIRDRKLRWLVRALAVLLVTAALAGAGTRAQQRIDVPPPPEPPDEGDQSVELSANLVTVTVVVRDSTGALVTDLAPDDFSIYEEGKRQDVDKFFHQGEVPL